jgi:hypothetical protein
MARVALFGHGSHQVLVTASSCSWAVESAELANGAILR